MLGGVVAVVAACKDAGETRDAPQNGHVIRKMLKRYFLRHACLSASSLPGHCSFHA